MKQDIAVLLSSYNGEPYIRVQIDSILAQKSVNIHLYIRDDGSTDQTKKIIQEYADKNDNIYLINCSHDENLGIKLSFLSLLQYALLDNRDFQYFAFADQDDYWLPEKLSQAIDFINQNKKMNSSCLYYSNKTIVDKNLSLIRYENIHFYNDFFEGFTQSLASGCTMVFNRALAICAVSPIPEFDCYHDAWIHRLAKSVGAEILFDKRSFILYRQHGDNNVGAIPEHKRLHLEKFFFKRKQKFYKKFYYEIYRHHKDELCADGEKYIHLLINYDKNIASASKLAFDPQARKRGVFYNILWISKIIFRLL